MNEVGFLWKLLIALSAGVFGVAVAISIQHIKIVGVPRWLVGLAILVQLILSWGVFIFIIIFFKSGLLPDMVPNDDYSALTVAYFCSSIPHIVITTAIIIYNKEINKWLESRYGQEGRLPDMEQVKVSHDFQDNETAKAKKTRSRKPKTKKETQQLNNSITDIKTNVENPEDNF